MKNHKINVIVTIASSIQEDFSTINSIINLAIISKDICFAQKINPNIQFLILNK